MVKLPKVGGSTLGGVVRRIAAHSSLSGVKGAKWIQREPGVWAAHTPFRKLPVNNLTNAYLLLSAVRHPLQRALSQFYHFELSRSKIHKSLEEWHASKLETLHSVKDPEYRYLASQEMLDSLTMNATMRAAEVVHMYDFLVVTERMDESLLLLAHKLRLPWTEMLYLAAKVSTEQRSELLGSRTRPVVVHPPLLQEPEEVLRLIPEFEARNQIDYEIVRLANARLDQLADEYGKDRLHADLFQFRAALEKVRKECIKQDPPVPLVEAAKPCYYSDNGCGHECIDELFPLKPTQSFSDKTYRTNTV